MKLYSRRHIVFAVVASSVAAATLSAFVSRKIFSDGKAASKKEAQSAIGLTVTDTEQASSESSSTIETTGKNGDQIALQTNTPALQVVAATDGGYTQDEAQNIAVYEKCNEAVVNITTQVMGYNWFLEPVVTSSGSGSGSIIDKRGYVVTNVHVIENASTINISLADGSTYEGRVIGKDTESDIAVLKFEPASNVELKTIAFGDSENLKVGQKVIAIGNPFALERTMTTGIISGLGRPIQESENVIIRNMIQTDAAINPGNSGGPLLDSQGRMIGINTMIYSSSGSSAGVGFAIPVSTARRVVADLLKYGEVRRGVMRISLVQNTGRIASYAGYGISSGVIVSKVSSGSEAQKAGIKGGTKAVQYGTFNPTTIYLGGDIITAIDSINVRNYADYASALEDKRPGDTITVTVYRDKSYQKIKVKLESSPQGSSTNSSGKKTRSL